jgi:hypothetical protein
MGFMLAGDRVGGSRKEIPESNRVVVPHGEAGSAGQ